MNFNANDIELSKLYDVAELIINNYKQQLEIDNINASNDLVNSIEWNIVQKDENTLTLQMDILHYFYYVEFGRQPSKTDGWDNPISDLSNWIINKIKKGKFIPKADKPIPTTQQEIKRTASAIYSKITKYGYYGYNQSGKHPLQTSLQKSANEGLIDKFVNAIGGELANEIVVELNTLNIKRKYKK